MTNKQQTLNISDYEDLVSLHLFEHDIGYEALYTSATFLSKENKHLPYYIFNENGTHLAGLVSPSSSPLFISNLMAISLSQDPIIIHIFKSSLVINSPLYDSLSKYKSSFKTLPPDIKFQEIFDDIHEQYNKTLNIQFYADQINNDIKHLEKLFHTNVLSLIDNFRDVYYQKIKNSSSNISTFEDMINKKFSYKSLHIFNKFKYLLDLENSSYKNQVELIASDIFSIFAQFQHPVNDCIHSYNILDHNDTINGVTTSLDSIQEFHQNLFTSISEIQTKLNKVDSAKLQLSEEFNQFLFMAVSFEFYLKFEHLENDSKFHYLTNSLLPNFNHYYQISHFLHNSTYVTANILSNELSPLIENKYDSSFSFDYLIHYQNFISNIQQLTDFNIFDYNEINSSTISKFPQILKKIQNFVELSLQHLEHQGYHFSESTRIHFKNNLENNFVIGIIQNNLDESSFPLFHENFRTQMREQFLVQTLHNSNEPEKPSAIKRKI